MADAGDSFPPLPCLQILDGGRQLYQTNVVFNGYLETEQAPAQQDCTLDA